MESRKRDAESSPPESSFTDEAWPEIGESAASDDPSQEVEGLELTPIERGPDVETFVVEEAHSTCTGEGELPESTKDDEVRESHINALAEADERPSDVDIRTQKYLAQSAEECARSLESDPPASVPNPAKRWLKMLFG